jgi:hypothetical protein
MVAISSGVGIFRICKFFGSGMGLCGFAPAAGGGSWARAGRSTIAIVRSMRIGEMLPEQSNVPIELLDII